MQKFSFKEEKEYLIPESAAYKPPLDKDGNPISGDALLRRMAKIAVAFETKHKRPVPIADQRFIAWLKQAAGALDKGMSSEEIFRRSVV